MKKLSLIVPTYNRAAFLQGCLDSFINQSLNKQEYEIVVVDNNSHDNTKEIVFSYINTTDLTIKYVFEPRQGVHYARNTGALTAESNLLVFGDDDIVATHDWLKNILDEFELNNVHGIVGGKVIPLWKDTPTEWIYDYGTKEIHAVFAYLDYGKERKILNNEYLFSCNFAIRKDVLIKAGGFAPDVLPRYLKYLSGSGENLVVDNVRHLGHEIVYLPHAIVYHHADSSRITLDYFIDRYQRFAIEEVFTCYRNHTKTRATYLMIKKALSKIVTAYVWQCKNVIKMFLGKKLLPINKLNPKYFIKIQKAFGWALLKQLIYVLYNKTVYTQITKKNYFD